MHYIYINSLPFIPLPSSGNFSALLLSWVGPASKCQCGQCGPVVRALALRSVDPGFKTHSDHSLSPWFNFSAALLNSQLVCLRPVGILNSCCCSVPSFRCVSLALKSPYGERSIKYVLYCIVSQEGTPDFKQQGWVNGDKNQNPKKKIPGPKFNPKKIPC